MIFVAYLVVFGVNLAPAFMPPSWAVLTFFYIEFDLPLLPLTIGGALASGFGRVVLATGSRRARQWVTRGREEDVEALRRFLLARERGVLWGTFLYALGPLPTNHLFIAAGLIGVGLLPMLIGFWLARSIADTFWVWATARAIGSLDSWLDLSEQRWLAVVAQLVGFALLLVLLRLPWRRWLGRRR